MDTIVLASQSPRRKELLEWAEIPFEVSVKHTEELYPSDLDVADVPVYIARSKALAVKKELNSDRIILAADTIVVLDGQMIGKPKNIDDAALILSRLSGQKHSVITGVVLVKGETEVAFSDVTEVTFHELTTDQITFYVNKYQPLDKAGAYAIKEWIGVVGIQSIQGDFYNVMGLPVSRVVKALDLLKDS